MHLFLTNDYPAKGELYCATCVMIYMGHVSSNDDFRIDVVKFAEKYADKKVAVYSLPMLEDYPLFEAITIAPSTHFNFPMPVCWSHIKGYGKLPLQDDTENAEVQSQLIPGKYFYNTRKGTENDQSAS